MDVHFTANMEDALEHVADDKYKWRTLLKDFWVEFEPIVKQAEETAHVPKEKTDKVCPKCGKNLLKIWSKNKYFYGCENYPECSFTASIDGLEFKKEEYNPNFDWDQPCPKCQAPTVVRQGKFGVFLGCSKYPECNGIINVPRKEDIPQEQMPGCPAIGCDGSIVMRRSRFGKPFYSCSNYPDCDVIVNDLSMLEEKYPNHPKTAYVKKSRFGKKSEDTKPKKVAKKASKKAMKKVAKKAAGTKEKKTSTQKAMPLPKELQELVKQEALSRPELTKALWDYIKDKKLQNPDNKRQIVPDEALGKALGTNQPFDMMKLASLLSKKLK
jgi:DNA topoisomerase-1